MSATCHICKRGIAVGESAWASDWTVLDTWSETARWRTETRYTCDECEADR